LRQGKVAMGKINSIFSASVLHFAPRRPRIIPAREGQHHL